MELMDEKSRLQLSKMIKANDVSDQTELIRSLKHSHLLQADINTLLFLKAKHRNDIPKIHEEGVQACNFLHTYYTDIYTKVRKDEIDLTTLNTFLNVLRRIEDGEIDQHDGSYMVGTLLKKLYVDSALLKADKLDAENGIVAPSAIPVEDISWVEFKKVHM